MFPWPPLLGFPPLVQGHLPWGVLGGRPSAGHNWLPFALTGPVAPTERSPVNATSVAARGSACAGGTPHCLLSWAGSLGLAPAVSWAGRAHPVPWVTDQDDTVVQRRLTPGLSDSAAHLELARRPLGSTGSAASPRPLLPALVPAF